MRPQVLHPLSLMSWKSTNKNYYKACQCHTKADSLGTFDLWVHQDRVTDELQLPINILLYLVCWQALAVLLQLIPPPSACRRAHPLKFLSYPYPPSPPHRLLHLYYYSNIANKVLWMFVHLAMKIIIRNSLDDMCYCAYLDPILEILDFYKSLVLHWILQVKKWVFLCNKLDELLTNCWNCRHHLSYLKPIQNCRFSCSVKSKNQNSHLSISQQSSKIAYEST